MMVSIFVVMACGLLAADIYSHKGTKAVSLQGAVSWSLLYIAAALVFAGYLYSARGPETASLFLTGYTLEKVLAFDNLFVFSLIFAYFKIPDNLQHKALHWGIAGAVVFRAIFVGAGVGLMESLGPVVDIVFAFIIMVTLYVMVSAQDDEADYNNAGYIKWVRKLWPNVTPFVLAIVAIEVSDIMFSFDSVPAVMAVTKEPFLIYSAMMFAILGLRSLYFVISALSRLLTHMDGAIMVVLGFIALELLSGALLDMHIVASTKLIIIMSILGIGVISSLVSKEEKACE